MAETIKLSRDDRGVAWLTLSRPEKHNALSGEMMVELTEAAAQLATDPEARIVVLQAEGKSFCAGGDLAWMRAQFEMDAETRRAESAKISTFLQALDHLPQPVIAAVQGNAFGGALGLISVCDHVIAAQDVSFGFTETRLGLIPANIAPFVLRRMGAGPARRVLMSARLFDAAEAEALGLVQAVVPAEGLDAAVEEVIAPYLSCAPGAVAETKALLRDLGHGVSSAEIERAIDALARRWQTEEAQAGISAFFAKTAPPWRKT